MTWLTETAPIRLKLLVIFSIMTGLVALAAIAGEVGVTMGGTGVGIAAGVVPVLLAMVLGFRFREVVAGPYVSTVLRMEALAAGDLDSPIPFTHYRDCIGRITKAMFVFRDAAVAERTKAADQAVMIGTMNTHLGAVSGGDLTATIDTDFPVEYVELKNNFNEALANLRGLIAAVTDSAAAIRTGSGEIAQAAEDLARRTEGNAASLEETAASVNQMDSRLKATAGAAKGTVERADQTISTVGGGRAVAEQAVQAMGRVSESAKGIDSVIEGLDKIAFQTRVLAMNAAVEAGRAGDAGRGFAVVADLVSALAMRAEEEAKRARDQLTVTQTDIVTAVEAVQKVDGALTDISSDVGHVHELLATIASDNQAQSAAITEISGAIGTMDQSTQQNAAMVEQTSAAARNLASEVGNLAQQAAQFRVDKNGGTRPGVPSAGKAKLYVSPVKPLPAAAIPALVRSDEDWREF
jgi:methyl-accepting chemotaxis protein